MSWREEAEVIAPARKPTGTWRDEAEVVVPSREVATGAPSPEWATTVEAPEPNSIGPLRAALMGATQGVTGRASDELSGLLGASAHGLSGALGLNEPKTQIVSEQDPTPRPEPTLGDVYRDERDADRLQNEMAREQNKAQHIGGEVGGDILLQSILAAASGGASLTPGAQAAIGGATGLMGSEADLTKPTLDNYLKAGGQSAATAALSGLGAAGARKFANWLGNRRVTGLSNIDEAATEKAAKMYGKDVAVAAGDVGSVTQKGSRILENLGRERPNVSDELRQAIDSTVADPAAQEMREGVVKHGIENLPGVVKDRAAKKAVLDALLAAEVEKLAANKAGILERPIRDIVLPRMKNYASRAIPTYVSSKIGGPGGAVTGMAVGASLGKPTTALANIINDPVTRAIGLNALKLPEWLADVGGDVAPIAARQMTPAAFDALSKYLDGGDDE